MLISSLDTQPLYESCWLRRKCHQLSGMQQHIAQTYVPAKPETCYCMCEGAVINTGREMLWVLHWTPTMCLCAFYSAVGLHDCASVCSRGERSLAWSEPQQGRAPSPMRFPFSLETVFFSQEWLIHFEASSMSWSLRGRSVRYKF